MTAKRYVGDNWIGRMTVIRIISAVRKKAA